MIATPNRTFFGKELVNWAITRLDEEAEHYFVTNKIFTIPWNQHLVDYSVMAHPMQPSFPITEFGSLKEGNWYIKLGRTTGVATGVWNGALACCNGKERYKIQDHDGRGIDLNGYNRGVCNSKQHGGGGNHASRVPSLIMAILAHLSWSTKLASVVSSMDVLPVSSTAIGASQMLVW